MNRDDSWAFQDATYTGPDTSFTILPLQPVDVDDISALKNLMAYAGSRGILPTRKIVERYTLQRKQKTDTIPDDGKQNDSLEIAKPIVDSAILANTSDVLSTPMLAQGFAYDIPF